MMFIKRKTLTRSAIALPAALALSPAAMAEPTDFVVDDEHFSMFFEHRNQTHCKEPQTPL